MNWRSIGGVVRRDLAVVARSRPAVLPIIMLPLIFFVLLPVLTSWAIPAGAAELDELLPLINAMPQSIREQLGDGPIEGIILRYLFEFQFVSLFLIVPLMVAAVIAADSLAGEKERKTIEALLYTPTTDLELYLAKLLGPWLAAIGVATFGYVLFVVAANVTAPAVVTRPIAVNSLWIVTLVWLNPAVAALALGTLVMVSARVRGFMEAYQLGATIVLPVVLLMIAQFSGLLFLDAGLAVVIGAVTWIVALGILRLGYRWFRRERLLLTS